MKKCEAKSNKVNNSKRGGNHATFFFFLEKCNAFTTTSMCYKCSPYFPAVYISVTTNQTTMQQVLKADENINSNAIAGKKKTNVIGFEIFIGDC